MKARDYFILGLRLVGLVVSVYLIRSLLHNVVNYFRYHDWNQIWTGLVKFVCLLIALGGLRAAPFIVRFCLGKEPESPAPQQQRRPVPVTDSPQ